MKKEENRENKKKEKKIGLEIHITINSEKKIFNSVRNFNKKDEWENNHLISPWELGYIGVLPVINPEVIKIGIKLATILKMKIKKNLEFDRKIYNYFDLPKGYQITQKKSPLGTDGFFVFFNKKMEKKIAKIKSIHLEEDTAKSYREKNEILLDFNRSGNPLIELVTDPIFTELEEVKEFVENLALLLKYTKISDANMENGRFRIDVNFSFKAEETNSGRYELKNCNSLKDIAKVVEKKEEDFYKQKKNEREKDNFTLNFDEKKKEVKISRKKKEYFYVPETNIPIIKIKEEDIENARKENQKIPSEMIEKWKKNSNLGYEIIKNTDLFEKLTIIEDKKIKKNEFKLFYFKFRPLSGFAENINWYTKLLKIWENNKNKIDEKIEEIIRKISEINSEKKWKEIKEMVFFLEENNKLIENENKKKIEKEEEKIIYDLSNELKEEIKKQKKEKKRVENFFIGKLMKIKKIKLNEEMIKKIKEIIDKT